MFILPLPLFKVDKDAEEGVVAGVVRRWARAMALPRRKREKRPPPELERVRGDVVMSPVREIFTSEQVGTYISR